MTSKKIRRKGKHAEEEANLGQKEARLEKEKESELSRMGETSHGSEPDPEDESHSD
jgi:hypothetical protein